MCSLDGDACQVWREEPRRARVAHHCDGCGCTIAAGEAYLAHTSLFDGCWSREAMCFGCWCAREQYREAHPRSLVPAPSNLESELENCADYGDDGEDWSALLKSLKSWRMPEAAR